MHYNPKVKAKLFKDTKLTSRKRPRATSLEPKPKINLFPGILLPYKKRSTAKKLFIKTELCEDKNNVIKESLEQDFVSKKNNFDFPKPSSKKDVWTEFIKLDKPERIKIEESDTRKFFKSKVIHTDTLNK